MDGTRIQALVNRGYSLSAQRVGLPHQQFRPSGPGNPLAAANLIQTLPAAFSVDDYKFRRPSDYGKPEREALVDGSQLLVGDYLVGPSGTYFVAGLDALVPIVAVECSRTLTVTRPTFTRTLGRVRGIDGDTVATEAVLMSSWPASVVQGTKGEKSDSGVPDASRLPWWQILMPAIADVAFETDDILTDEVGHRYQVSSAELSSKGWRITAQLSEA